MKPPVRQLRAPDAVALPSHRDDRHGERSVGPPRRSRLPHLEVRPQDGQEDVEQGFVFQDPFRGGAQVPHFRRQFPPVQRMHQRKVGRHVRRPAGGREQERRQRQPSPLQHGDRAVGQKRAHAVPVEGVRLPAPRCQGVGHRTGHHVDVADQRLPPSRLPAGQVQRQHLRHVRQQGDPGPVRRRAPSGEREAEEADTAFRVIGDAQPGRAGHTCPAAAGRTAHQPLPPEATNSVRAAT